MNYIFTFLIGLIIGAFTIYTYQKNDFLDRSNNNYVELKKISEKEIQNIKQTYWDNENSTNQKVNKVDISSIKTPNYKLLTNKKNQTIIYTDYEKFKTYLETDNFYSALNIYKKILANNDKSSYSSLLKKYIFDKYEKSHSLGRYYAKKALEIEPDYYYFIYIWMISDAHAKNYKSAILKILELKSTYIPSESIIESVDKYYKSTTKNYLYKTLKSNNKNEILYVMNFFDEIQEYDSAQRLKNKIYELNDKDEQKVLLELEKWEKIKQKWKADDEKDRLSKLYNIQIPMQKTGKHYIIQAKINDNLKVRLMLDTGASYVSINSDIIRKYNFPIVKRNITFNTANGKVKEHIYSIDKFTIKDIDLFNFDIGELRNYSSKTNDGLLGMSFLEKFIWDFDAKNSILFLNKK